jgi:hypothetical protein
VEKYALVYRDVEGMNDEFLLPTQKIPLFIVILLLNESLNLQEMRL